MDIIQGLIETGNAGRSGWRIVNNGGVFGVYNNRTSNVSFSVLNNGVIGASSNIPSNIISLNSNINVITNYTSGSSSSGGSSQWTTVGTEIYYNSGNVGIGTTDPITPLHVYNNIATLPTLISVVGATGDVIGTTDRVISFPYSGSGTTKDYTFTTTEALICDILIVGGGGGGGKFGGGGGGGAILFGTNITLNAGSVSIKVGNGGTGAADIVNSGINGVNGVDSSITLSSIEYIAKGGGGGGSRTANPTGINGSSGGSGGGGSHGESGTQSQGGISNKITYSGFQSFGNAGGVGKNNTTGSPSHASGGGGGAGSVGSGIVSTGGGNGGTGKEFIAYFGSSVGQSGWFAGGGGGNTYQDVGNGGYGNGGNGLFGGGGNGGLDGSTPIPATNGLANTGGGGGGGKYIGAGSNTGGNGGSGIIIIRYRKATSNSSARLLLDTTTTGTASVEFRRGTGVDMQNDYRLINDTNGSIKLLCENSTQSFGDATANLAWFSSNETIIHKNTAMNGRVGIGTNYHATRSLDVLGDANISGLVSLGGLSVSGSSNVIITNSLSSNVSLTIQNGLVPPTVTSPTLITVVGATGGTIGTTDRTLLFPYTSGTFTTYTFTPTENLECDILVVGGGGGGGRFGGGGGGGAILFGTNITLNASSSVSIKVGNGGAGATDVDNGVNGINGGISSITIGSTEYIAVGGGGGGTRTGPPTYFGFNGNSGGSGGGGSHADNAPQGLGGASNKNTYTGFQSFGNTGGAGKLGNNGTPSHTSGGGGGAGSVGSDVVSTGGGNGGSGKDFIEYFGSSVGHSGWFAGGGGGNTYSGAGNGGYGNGGISALGGGGNGGFDGGTTIPATNGLANTGGGGGGGKYTGTGSSNGGTGGTGIVIIRYRKPTTRTSSSIELTRGTTADANRDYKIGNYNGEFKVLSSTSSVDTDYIRITTAGAIFNPTGTASWNTGSDRRIKENIERASYDKCFENINRLELNRFNYIDGFNTVSRDRAQLGFIAQEVKDIFPKAISTQGYYTDTLNIPDLLSIDITQINYSLYGAVKKLIEINNEKDNHIKILGNKLKTLETILNITTDTSNILIDTSNLLDTSNITLDTSNVVVNTSNVVVDTSNVVVDTSNLLDTSNILIDTSNLLDTSNISIDTSNILIDTSNLLDTSNITLDTSNITLDTSNITIDTSNLLDTSNILIDTSNISIDTSNISIDN